MMICERENVCMREREGDRQCICVSDRERRREPLNRSGRYRGYLARKKQPPTKDHHGTLGIVLLEGPRKEQTSSHCCGCHCEKTCSQVSRNGEKE